MPSGSDRRTLLILITLAVASRLLFGLLWHPPSEHVYLDMIGYVRRAQDLLDNGFFGAERGITFHAWGTSTLLALLMGLFGSEPGTALDLFWSLASAGTVVFTYLAATRLSSAKWFAPTAGALALFWYPSMLAGSFFLSEGPFACALMALMWRFVVLWQDDRGALSVGLLASIAFILRPEVALLFAMLAVVLWFAKRRSPRLWLLAFGPPFATLLFSLWVFHHHNGRLGIARTSSLNLTLSRCQVSRLQIFDSDLRVRYSQSLNDGHLIGPVALWALSQRETDDFFAPRPALGRESRVFELEDARGDMRLVSIGPEGKSLRWSGDMTDPAIHRQLLQRCLSTSGVRGQIRASVLNMSALWFFNSQWPDSSPRNEAWLRVSDPFVKLAWLLWFAGGLMGLRLAWRERKERPEAWLLALPVITILLVAGVWFGSVRLRTPYDGFALLLALTWVETLIRRPDPAESPAA
jgi:hypothetical protein